MQALVCAPGAERGRVDGADVGWTFEPTPAAPGAVRRRLRTLLACWGLARDDVDVVVLVANELVSNAVDHAATTMTVTVGRDDDRILLGVTDGSAAPPLVRPHDPLGARGRGMQLVQALAQRWECVPVVGGGKTVWAEVVVTFRGGPVVG